MDSENTAPLMLSLMRRKILGFGSGLNLPGSCYDVRNEVEANLRGVECPALRPDSLR